MKLFEVICTDKESTCTIGTKPLTITSIDSDMTNTNP